MKVFALYNNVGACNEAMLELVVDIGKYAPYSFLESVASELARTPIVAVTEEFLLSLAYYTVSVLQNIERKQETVLAQQKEAERLVAGHEADKELVAASYRTYDLTIFWNLATCARKEVKVDTKLKDYSIKCLLIVCEKSAAISKWVANLIFANLSKEGPETLRVIKFFVYFHKFMKNKWEIKEFIKTNTNAESGVLIKLFKGFIKYKRKVNEQFSAGEEIKDPMQFVS